MDLTVYTQFYRCTTAVRQSKIDQCVRRNLTHPGNRKLVVFKESDAPQLPEASVELMLVESNTRKTYAEWFRWVQRLGRILGLLLNADIYLDKGLKHLAATWDTEESFLALTSYNPAMLASISTTSPTGLGTCGAYGPMRNCRRACSRPINGPNRYLTKITNAPNTMSEIKPYTRPERH